MKFKVFSFIPLLFLPISIISTEHNFFELEKNKHSQLSKK